MTHLIIGYGEVGKGLHQVLPEAAVSDLTLPPVEGHFDVVHVAIPYSERFVEIVEQYVQKHTPGLVIVHSSVALCTTEKIQGAVHSPIRGVHPHLGLGIKTFVKYFGGERADEAAALFESRGVPIQTYPSSRTTEAIKLWDTTQYGWMIVLEKLIHSWCEGHEIDFDAVYTEANKDYNDGYRQLGRPDVVRPYLKHMDGPIGGHCVIPNAQMLTDSGIARFILAVNERFAHEGKTAEKSRAIFQDSENGNANRPTV